MSEFDQSYLNFSLQRDYPAAPREDTIKPIEQSAFEKALQATGIGLEQAGRFLDSLGQVEVPLLGKVSLADFVPFVGSAKEGTRSVLTSGPEWQGTPMALQQKGTGQSLTRGTGFARQLTEDAKLATMDVATNIVPVAKAVGKVGKVLAPKAAEMAVNVAEKTGMPVRGLGIVEDTSYRGSHSAPSRDFGAPLNDLTGDGGIYPADVYSAKGAHIYGDGWPFDRKAFDIANQFKNKPNAMVTIYRAVPREIPNSEKLAEIEGQMAAYLKRSKLPDDAFTTDGSKWYDWAAGERDRLRELPDKPSNEINTINPGDWVTITRDYAKEHGQSVLNSKYKIITKKVKASDIYTNGDSIHEWGYDPARKEQK